MNLASREYKRTWFRFLLTLTGLTVLATGFAESKLDPGFWNWAKKPVMGWNSWDCFATTVTEAQVHAQTDVMRDKLAKYGWNLITVDIQWYEPQATGFDYRQGAKLVMDAYGRLMPAPNRFPTASGSNGFKTLADYVHHQGLKFGIHLMRGIPRQAVEAKTPVLGTKYTAADIANPNSKCPWNSDMYGVDMSKPGAQEYYNSVFSLIASWGVDLVKVDDLSRPYSTAEIEAIRKAIDHSGRHIILSTSPGATPVDQGNHVSTHANMWRISDDFWDSWPALVAQFARLDAWTPYRGPGHFPDADMLPLGTIAMGSRQTNFKPQEQRTLLTLWSIAKSPLILGADLTKLDEETLALLTDKEVLAVDQDSLNNRQLFRTGNSVAWVADVPHSKDKYLALFNLGDSLPADTIAAPLGRLGFSGICRVRDLWSHQEELVEAKNFESFIPAHGAKLFRVSSK